MGDRSSLIDVDALYRTHRLAMLRLALLLVDDIGSAEDVVQSAFVGLSRNQVRVRGPESAVGYLRRAVVNGSRSALRRRRTARLHLRAAEPEAGEPLDACVVRSEEHGQDLALVRQLPPRQREVLVLRYRSGLSEGEIAAALGISTGTVKSQASRALSHLHEAMGTLF